MALTGYAASQEAQQALAQLADNHPAASDWLHTAAYRLRSGDRDAAGYALYQAWFVLKRDSTHAIEAVLRSLDLLDGPEVDALWSRLTASTMAPIT